MTLIVQKYGGTSVGSVERIQAVAERVLASHRAGQQVVVVVSAMSGETDRLLQLARAMDSRPSPRELDTLLSTGEQVTIALLSMALQARGQAAISFTGGQVPITTDSAHNKARIEHIEASRIRNALASGAVVIVAGFQGVDGQGNITTLGRGGSDTTAVALAAALRADECQIYTDVDGIYTTDPRVEPRARRLDRITFEEMLEMASLGAKVLQTRSVEFAMNYRVPVRVLSSFTDGPGTLVTEEENAMEAPRVSGIAFSRNEAKVTVSGVPDRPGIAHAILGPISAANINVDVILQNVSAAGRTDFTFTVERGDFDRTMEILRGVAEQLQAEGVRGDTGIAKVSAVGVGMRSHAGIAASMFAALSKENINIQMISTSEIKISVVIDEKYLELAVRTLHEAFGLERGDTP
ncbi:MULTISPECIES: aspartate kinase [Acidithiobacillus]|jgi:aspartate kinase|uniref:Aspartokinase n=3 Tax=Acidithiobacillus caldus TaxID=33059 RepID=F9ZRT3_ACICS|nr:MULTISPECIES: aspartate kinase [Acidithiobacillus]AEK59098.1 Aspartokinase [Acidithiobacillus caldus SM-1]AIA56142.1 Aspartokinase [Acidithiobacillus caldus ATCC 51756]AUW34077.1 aspartate kinase [Acidithiobacillus caldus]MBU2730367.1 aspartate kinase [Acidithiobacillus caldus]MBU2735505.1 aspartate kinase [Acidithiobacillus caldus ATCC 51756]